MEFVVIPRIQFTVKYIEKELDEESREDFFRLKRVTDKKKELKAEALYEKEKLEAAGVKVGEGHGEEESIFGNEEEENDIVF